MALVLVACGTPPAPSPGATSSANPTRNGTLFEFASRVRSGTATAGSFIQDLADASAATPDRLAAPARVLLLWTETELAWLDDHPADACYESAHRRYRHGLAEFADAAKRFAELAIASSPPSDAEGQAAGEPLSRAMEHLGEAADLAASARAVCG